uniref:Uncharacterized protein n=1 Tax=Daucus carota subsp. sativus TaxID=79200 RepID=A0A165XMX3_DAUCS
MISTIKNIRAASLSERDLVAKKLLNKIPPTDCSAPAELQSLMSKEYVFKLSRNKYNIVDGRQNYGVSAVYVSLQELESAYAEKSLPQGELQQLMTTWMLSPMNARESLNLKIFKLFFRAGPCTTLKALLGPSML